jgi:chromosome segregation ATPase
MNSIEAAAHDLTHAQSELEEATAQAERTGSAMAVLQSRLTAKQQDMTNLRDRRLAEQEQESDAALAALLALDIESLQPIVGSAHASHQAACTAVQQAQKAIGQAQQAYERCQAGEQAVALEARLRALEEMLMGGIAQLHALKKAATGSIHVHGSHLFAVSPRLLRFAQQGVLPT